MKSYLSLFASFLFLDFPTFGLSRVFFFCWLVVGCCRRNGVECKLLLLLGACTII